MHPHLHASRRSVHAARFVAPFSIGAISACGPATHASEDETTTTAAATTITEVTETSHGAGSGGVTDEMSTSSQVDSTGSGESEGFTSRCGNGVVEADEECDDANVEDGDACTSDCSLPFILAW